MCIRDRVHTEKLVLVLVLVVGSEGPYCYKRSPDVVRQRERRQLEDTVHGTNAQIWFN